MMRDASEVEGDDLIRQADVLTDIPGRDSLQKLDGYQGDGPGYSKRKRRPSGYPCHLAGICTSYCQLGRFIHAMRGRTGHL